MYKLLRGNMELFFVLSCVTVATKTRGEGLDRPSGRLVFPREHSNNFLVSYDVSARQSLP